MPKREGEGGGGSTVTKKSRLTQKTAAEFFAENKHFAGAPRPARLRAAHSQTSTARVPLAAKSTRPRTPIFECFCLPCGRL